MLNEKLLVKMSVSQARGTVPPILVRPEQSFRGLLLQVTQSPEHTQAYVVDQENRLLGSIPIKGLIEYVFPYTAAYEHGKGLVTVLPKDIDDCSAADLMDEFSASVTDDCHLDKVVQVLMSENAMELPVVDADRHVIGAITMCDILQNCLKKGKSTCAANC